MQDRQTDMIQGGEINHFHKKQTDLMTNMQVTCQRERDSSHQTCRRYERTKMKHMQTRKRRPQNEKVQISKTPYMGEKCRRKGQFLNILLLSRRNSSSECDIISFRGIFRPNILSELTMGSNHELVPHTRRYTHTHEVCKDTRTNAPTPPEGIKGTKTNVTLINH